MRIDKTYLGVLEKYAVFSGRATRSEFWLFELINAIVIIALGVLGGTVADWIAYVGVLFILAILIPSLAVTVRRLHDTGRSGWWYFISFIPLIGPVILIIFLVLGSDQDNEYGPKPDTQTGA